MDDIFTLKSYLNNPGGKGSSVGIALQTAKNHYMEEFKKVEGKMSLKWFYTPKKDYLCAHITLPSQSTESILYDIVFEFHLGETRTYGDYILDYPVKVFSNAPSFMYTYAYAFHKEKRLVSWSKTKYPPNTLSTEPVSKNPYKQISFERSIYLAAAYLQNRREYVPLALGTGTQINKIAMVADYVQDMDSLDKKRKDAKLQKNADSERKKAPINPGRPKNRTTPSTSTKPSTSSATKKPKSANGNNIKKAKGTKKPKKGIK